MVSFRCTVQDENGIHARPAGVLVSCAKKFCSQVTIRKNDREADGKRLLAVMGLGAKHGEILEFTVDGSDEHTAAAELERICRDVIG